MLASIVNCHVHGVMLPARVLLAWRPARPHILCSFCSHVFQFVHAVAQVRRLMAMRQEPGWQFPTLFLVKDSLAVMLEGAAMLEDALREYSELEACYLEALAGGGPLSQHPFGEVLPGLQDALSTVMHGPAVQQCWYVDLPRTRLTAEYAHVGMCSTNAVIILSLTAATCS